MGVRVDAHPDAAEHADDPGQADREHRQSDCGDEIGVDAANVRGALLLRLARGVRRNNAAVEDPDRAEDDDGDERRAKLVLQARELFDDRIAEEAPTDVGERDRPGREDRDRRQEHDEVDRELAHGRLALDVRVGRAATQPALQRDPGSEPEREAGDDLRNDQEQLEAKRRFASRERAGRELPDPRRDHEPIDDVLPDLGERADRRDRRPEKADERETVEHEVADPSGAARDERRAAIAVRDPEVVGEGASGRERHRARAESSRLPLGLEPEERSVRRGRPEEGALQDEAERPLPVAPDEERGDDHDDVEVEAAPRGCAVLDRAPGDALRVSEVDEPGGKSHDEEGHGEARLLPVDLARLVEVGEDEWQPGESAGRRVRGDLRADPQQVRHGEHDHVHGHERDEIEVRALHAAERSRRFGRS